MAPAIRIRRIKNVGPKIGVNGPRNASEEKFWRKNKKGRWIRTRYYDISGKDKLCRRKTFAKTLSKFKKKELTTKKGEKVKNKNAALYMSYQKTYKECPNIGQAAAAPKPPPTPKPAPAPKTRAKPVPTLKKRRKASLTFSRQVRSISQELKTQMKYDAPIRFQAAAVNELYHRRKEIDLKTVIRRAIRYSIRADRITVTQLDVVLAAIKKKKK